MFNYDGDYDSFKLGFLIGWRTGGKRTRLPLTALTSGDDFDIQKIVDVPNLTSCSIACKKEYYGNAPEAIYIAYIADGVARIKTALHKSDISSHVWQDTGFSTSAIDVSIAFDGKMPRTHGHVEFLTDSRPYVFWVTSSGELKVSILGFLGEMILANENCTKVSAIRATQSDIISDDFGLVVFFIVNGQIYYRQHIKGIWYDAVPLSVGPSGVTYTDIRAFRTWDYRIGVQAKTSSGEVYEIFSQFQGIGKNSSEHLEITSVSVAGALHTISYHDAKSSDEHLEITSVAISPALYGGLYKATAPQIISAYNLEDPQHDWGKIAVFVFDCHLVASEVSAQPSAFSIKDSRNMTFAAQTAALGSDGKTVTLTFIDFNAAMGTCTANYTPGTVTSMAGTTLTATYISWTPINLVAPQIPVPEVYSIENVGYQGTGIKRVRFYSTDGETILETEYVGYGEDAGIGPDNILGNSITVLNANGIAITSSSITNQVGLIEAYEYSAGYEGFNIQLNNLTPGKSFRIKFKYQTISGAYFGRNYVYGFKIFDNQVTSYPTTTQEASGYEALIEDFDEHEYSISFTPSGNTAYLVFAMPDYSDSGQNVFRIRDLQVDNYSDEAWALTAFTGIGVPNITENVTSDLDLYLARWRVRYYSQDGTYIRYTEYVVDGEDAVWGDGRDWSSTSGGAPSSNILENISSNIDVYSCSDYIALPYIQSDGNNQWINTAITIKANTKIEADIYVDRYVAGSASYLCAYGSGSGTGYLGFSVTANNRVGDFTYCGGGNGYMTAVGAYEQQIKVIINHATGLAQWFDSNGDLIAGVQHSTVNPSSGGSIGIFALSDWGRGTAMKGRLYGFKIYEGSTLVFDGRPALDDQNVPCLYDMISTSYFYSYTSTPFSAPTE